MSLFQSILVPLDGSELSARSLGCATWLASGLQARLHILSAAAEVLPARDALTRLRVPDEAWPLITVHQGGQDPKVEILAAVERYAIDLIAITARGEALELTAGEDRGGPPKIAGHVTQAIIEKAPVPVLLIPPRYQEALPWETVLVPMSGEPGTDASLTLAIRLANALDLKVNIVHVVDFEEDETSATAMGSYSDQPHHEHPSMLNEFIDKACLFCSAEEKRCIEDFSLCQGDVTTEILKLAEQKQISLLVVGWHGQFMVGHAQVLKNLCQTVTFPVLLIKPAAKATFKLKVGEEI